MGGARVNYHRDDLWLKQTHRDLVGEGVIAPLSQEPGDRRLWVDCEIASCVENRFFETLDPRTMDAQARDGWKERVLGEDEYFEDPPGARGYTAPYWLMDDGRRVGTVALDTMGSNPPYVTVSALYVFPDVRGRGVAGRLLKRLHARVTRNGGWGIRVPTHWTWQSAVRFYMGLGLWVVSWKRNLVFGWCRSLPRRIVEVADEEARFAVVPRHKTHTRILATRRGDRLEWRETRAHARSEDFSVHVYGAATLSLALALAGWPLIRSDETWEKRHHWSDIGEPEGLAYKIEIFEALDRQEGFVIRTPRLPGLRYRDIDAID